MPTIPAKDYCVAYDGIFARIVLAGPIDIGVTYFEAEKLAREHMQYYRDIRARELAALDERLIGLTT